MNSILFNSFQDELEKISVNVRLLGQRLGKIKNVRNYESAGADLGANVAGMKVDLPSAVEKMPVIQTLQQTANRQQRLARMFPTKSRQDAAAAAQKAVADMSRDQMAALRQEVRAGKFIPGEIRLDPRRFQAALPAFAGKPALKTQAQRDALTALAGMHEVAERRSVRAAQSVGAKKGNLRRRIKSHLHPSVLVEEHNMLSRLTGPGAGKARDVIRGMRRVTGEDDIIRHLLIESFGPRAAAFTQEGTKIPSAMRRALYKKLADDPGLLARAERAAVKERGVVGESRRKIEEFTNQIAALQAAQKVSDQRQLERLVNLNRALGSKKPT